MMSVVKSVADGLSQLAERCADKAFRRHWCAAIAAAQPSQSVAATLAARGFTLVDADRTSLADRIALLRH